MTLWLPHRGRLTNFTSVGRNFRHLAAKFPFGSDDIDELIGDGSVGAHHLSLTTRNTLPSDPSVGDVILFEAATGINWLLRYNGTKWEFMGGPSLFAEDVAGSVSRTGSTYGDPNSGAAGPSLTTPQAGDYELIHGCTMWHNAVSGAVLQSVEFGAVAASDLTAVWGQNPSGEHTIVFTSARTRNVNGLTTGMVAKCVYRISGAGTGTFSRRWLKLTPRALTA